MADAMEASRFTQPSGSVLRGVVQWRLKKASGQFAACGCSADSRETQAARERKGDVRKRARCVRARFVTLFSDGPVEAMHESWSLAYLELNLLIQFRSRFKLPSVCWWSLCAAMASPSRKRRHVGMPPDCGLESSSLLAIQVCSLSDTRTESSRWQALCGTGKLLAT